MALTGIRNANEFYSAHYLESVLTGDIKKVRERWAEQAKAQLEGDPAAEVSTPDARFRALRKPWLKLRAAEFGITADPAERLRLQRELFLAPLCEALGYSFAPNPESALVAGEAYQNPLLAEVSNTKGEPWLWVLECFNPSDDPAERLKLTIARHGRPQGCCALSATRCWGRATRMRCWRRPPCCTASTPAPRAAARRCWMSWMRTATSTPMPVPRQARWSTLCKEAFHRAVTDTFQRSCAEMGGQLSVVFAAGRIEVAWEPAAPGGSGQRRRGEMGAVFGLHVIAYNLIRLGNLLKPAMVPA